MKLEKGSMYKNLAWTEPIIATPQDYEEDTELFSNLIKKYSRIDFLQGIEYSGFTDSTLSLEAVNRSIIDLYSDFQYALRISKKLLNDTLNITLVSFIYGEKMDDGSICRLSTEYDLTDSVKIKGSIVTYQSGDLIIFENIKDNDRFIFNVKYSF